MSTNQAQPPAAQLSTNQTEPSSSNSAQPPAGPVAQQLQTTQSSGQQTPTAIQAPPPQKKKSTWTGFSDKTLWDWLQLLLIPVLIATGGIWFQIQQHDTDIQISQKQHDSDQQIATDNRQKDIRIAADQQQATTLKAYFDDMTDLLLNHGLRQSKPDDEVRVVARAKTLTALRGLNGDRKVALVQFLYEAGLIGGLREIPYAMPLPNAAIVSLDRADLEAVNLSLVDLEAANLNGVDLRGANLSCANLVDANLSYANLSGANLTDAVLVGADLEKADLEKANLGGANLSNSYRVLNEVAVLQGANLGGADLEKANLRGVVVTDDQLASALILKDATLPNGSTYPSQSEPIPNHADPQPLMQEV